MHSKDGIIFLSLNTRDWGLVKLAKITPRETSWGQYESLKGTLEGLIPEVASETLDRAHRGDPTPLMRCVKEPLGCLKKIEVSEKCTDQEGCLSYVKSKCNLRSRKAPECFSPDSETNLRPILLAWRDGFYLIRERQDDEIL
jgi:hypothetical protein